MRNSLLPLSRLALFSLAAAVTGQAHAAPPQGRFVIVGMGTAADLITVRAQRAIAKAQVVMAEEGGIRAMWSEYARGKEVWEWPHDLRKFYGARIENFKNPAQRAEAQRLDKLRRDLGAKITRAVRAGKTVACLEGGDPMIFGMTLFLELLPPDIPTEIVPGIGSFQAASAALKKAPPYGYDTSGVILTMEDWQGRADTNEKLMAAGSTMVVYTMNLDYPAFFARLKRHYPATTPVAVVCDAGSPDQQKILRSTVGSFEKDVNAGTLPVNRHLLFIGKFLESGQARMDFVPRVTEIPR